MTVRVQVPRFDALGRPLERDIDYSESEVVLSKADTLMAFDSLVSHLRRQLQTGDKPR